MQKRNCVHVEGVYDSLYVMKRERVLFLVLD